MAVKKMTLTAYSNGRFSKKVGKPYEVMLNPEKLNWSRSINYSFKQAVGTSAPSPTYNKTPSEKLSFELVIDCTGVVDSKRTSMASEINRLTAIIYTYNGDIHKPNFVKIIWNGVVIKGLLTSFSTTYTLFSPDGAPLRARLSLEFISYETIDTIVAEEKNNSPDMTHLVTVEDGDTLPQISEQIYLSAQHYVQIAQFNGLNKFRHLQAGTVVVVPPLIPASVAND